MFPEVEHFISAGVDWLRLFVECIGALVITIGIIKALKGFVHHVFFKKTENFNPIRLIFAKYLAMGLEFQLAADILSTAVAPSWDRIGKLAAIVVIRTVLNYFLMKEMREEEGLKHINKASEEN
ncbi:MAG: DUF1622 domain-containing protein [Planctomycetota bacterium]